MNRQIDVGGVISRVFEIYRDQAAVLLPVAAAIFIIEAVLGALLVSISPILILVAIAVQIVVLTLYQGMVVNLVSDVQDGRRDNSVGDLFRSVRGAVVPLIAAGVLAGLGIALGFLLLIVPGLFLLTIWAVIAPVVVLERPGVLTAFGRSHELVRGHGWPVFGVIVLLFLIVIGVGLVLGAIGAAIGDAGRYIADFLGSVLTAPLSALAAAVLYFSLREPHGEGVASEAQPGIPAASPAQQSAGQPVERREAPPG
jgi:hypothetical protein